MVLNAVLLDARLWAAAPLLDILTSLRRQSQIPSLKWSTDNEHVTIAGESASSESLYTLHKSGDLTASFKTRLGLASLNSWEAFKSEETATKEPWDPLLVKTLLTLDCSPQHIWLMDRGSLGPWLTFRHEETKDKFVLAVDSSSKGFTCTRLVTGEVEKGRFWGERLVVEDIGISVPPLYPTPPLAALSLVASSA